MTRQQVWDTAVHWVHDFVDSLWASCGWLLRGFACDDDMTARLGTRDVYITEGGVVVPRDLEYPLLSMDGYPFSTPMIINDPSLNTRVKAPPPKGGGLPSIGDRSLQTLIYYL